MLEPSPARQPSPDLSPAALSPAALSPAALSPAALSAPPSSSPTRQTTRRLELVPTTLGLVAPFVAETLDRHPPGRRIIELSAPDRGSITPIGRRSPLEHLRGTTAGERCAGLAVVDDHAVLLVWRNGTGFRTAPASGDAADTPVVSLYSSLDPVADAMRRALGISTPAPMFGPAWYWLLVWIRDLAEFVGARPLGPHDVACRHPGIDPTELDDQVGDPVGDPVSLVEFCLDRLYEHARLTGWDGVRADAVDGWLELGSCPPDLARWHDAGSFGRDLQRQLPTPNEALNRLAAVDHRLTDQAIELLMVMIDGLGSLRALAVHR